MTTIAVEVAGDRWINRQWVVEAIHANCGAPQLIFRLNAEGPSLHALGIVSAIMECTASLGIESDRIWIDQWHNPVEQIPFQRVTNPQISHFFWMSDRYRHQSRISCQEPKAMSFFVGRLTTERAVIMKHILEHWSQHFLLSLMRQHGDHDVFKVGSHEPWVSQDQQPAFLSWCRHLTVGSITDHWVRDQYDPGHNTNAALVRHYDGFCLELVAETYCLGETFFPTEKTVRPLSQGKPVLIFGARRFLSRLRDLGFQTWHTVWNEDYDELEGPARWSRMLQQIDHILEHRLYLHQDIPHIGLHNQKNLERLIKEHRPG